MGKKLYTFKCGCQAEEPKIVEITVRGRFCPTCFNANKDHTSQHKYRIQSLDFECEQCGKPQQRRSGMTQVFLCRECQHERQQEKIRQKLSEKRTQAQQKREHEEQERQRIEQERLAQERERLAHIERVEKENRERLAAIKRMERENAELKAKLAALEANPPTPEPEQDKPVNAVKPGSTKKVSAKCPRCEKEHTIKTNMEFNTRTTRWLFCPACAPAAKGSGLSEAEHRFYA